MLFGLLGLLPMKASTRNALTEEDQAAAATRRDRLNDLQSAVAIRTDRSLFGLQLVHAGRTAAGRKCFSEQYELALAYSKRVRELNFHGGPNPRSTAKSAARRGNYGASIYLFKLSKQLDISTPWYAPDELDGHC